ncbi:hypothetical protein FRC06_005684 [Ceratobasidium sp. 370]|nr:hypothetical protein FRC06_005684 [Ceratobasidium sp. 370]
MAIHDALRAIMVFTKAGEIHCDISAYNLLLINPAIHDDDKGLPNAPKSALRPTRQDYNGTGTKCAMAEENIQLSTSEYKCPQLQRVRDLGRGPVCIIHDTELTINGDKGKNEVHSDRTGTPVFISAQLLESYMTQRKVTRTYIHDAESLLWVLIWVVAHHSMYEDRWEISDAAAGIIRQLSVHNIKTLWQGKENMLFNWIRLVSNVQDMGTQLAQDLAPVIGELAHFFLIYLYYTPLDSGPDSGPTNLDLLSHITQPYDALHKQYVEESRHQTFDRLFGIINRHITWLQKMRPTPN